MSNVLTIKTAEQQNKGFVGTVIQRLILHKIHSWHWAFRFRVPLYEPGSSRRNRTWRKRREALSSQTNKQNSVCVLARWYVSGLDGGMPNGDGCAALGLIWKRDGGRTMERGKAQKKHWSRTDVISCRPSCWKADTSHRVKFRITRIFNGIAMQ